MRMLPKLGLVEDKIYFPECAYNLLTDRLHSDERGMTLDIPKHVLSYFALLSKQEQADTGILEQLFTSTNIYDMGLGIMLSHIMYNLCMSVERKFYRPMHLVVTDRDDRFWEPVTILLHSMLNMEHHIPLLPPTLAEGDKMLKHYAKLGTLPLIAGLPEEVGKGFRSIFEVSTMPLMLHGVEKVAAKLSGDPRVSFLSRPHNPHTVGYSVMFSSPDRVKAAIGDLLELVLPNRDKLAKNWVQAPGQLMYEFIGKLLGITAPHAYAGQLNTATHSIYMWNSAYDMFDGLRILLDSPTRSSKRIQIAQKGPLSALSEDYVALVESDVVHLHKDRVVRLLNGNSCRFNKTTLEVELTNLNMLLTAYTYAMPDCWTVSNKTWQAFVTKTAMPTREDQIQAILAAELMTKVDDLSPVSTVNSNNYGIG
jgi:hypothetical protein